MTDFDKLLTCSEKLDLVPRLMSSEHPEDIPKKTCSKCKIEQDISCFNIDKSKKNGIYNRCKSCRGIERAQAKIRKQQGIVLRTPFKKSETQELTCKTCNCLKKAEEFGDYKCNNELYKRKACYSCERIKRNQLYKLNPEKALRQKKRYIIKKTEDKDYSKNRGRRTYYLDVERSRKTHNKYNKRKRREDPAFRLRGLVSTAVYSNLKLNKSSKLGKSFIKYMDYTMEDLKAHLESLFEPWMNWGNHGKHIVGSNVKIWHIDHIIPQSKLPYTSMEDENFKKCWALSNLRPLEGSENISKKNKSEEEWLKSKEQVD